MHPWAWPGSCHPLPSGCLECRCNIKHQLMLETSYLVMETHANSTPVQVYATCMCLPKRKAKKHGHCRKNLRRLLTTIWQRKAVWKTSFFKQILRNYQSTLCIYPENSWTTQRMCQSKKALFISTLAQYFILQLQHSINKHDLNRALFWKTCTGKKCINSYTGLGEGCYLRASSWALSLEPIHAKDNPPLNCGRSADGCSPVEVASPKRLWSGVQKHLAFCTCWKISLWNFGNMYQPTLHTNTLVLNKTRARWTFELCTWSCRLRCFWFATWCQIFPDVRRLPKSELIGDLGIVQNLVDDLFTFLGLQSLQKAPCLFNWPPVHALILLLLQCKASACSIEITHLFSPFPWLCDDNKVVPKLMGRPCQHHQILAVGLEAIIKHVVEDYLKANPLFLKQAKKGTCNTGRIRCILQAEKVF